MKPIAMEFTGRVVIPPLPKNSAWISKTKLIHKKDTIGPKRIDRGPIPMQWAVVPPGKGIVIIININEKEVKALIKGRVSDLRKLFIFLME